MVLLRRLAILLVFVGVLVLGWKLADANSARLSIDYLLGRVDEVPTWLVLLVSFSAGVVAMAVMTAGRLMRGRLVQRRYRKTVEGLESEVHQLRNLPLGDDERAAEEDALAADGGASMSARAAPAAAERGP